MLLLLLLLHLSLFVTTFAKMKVVIDFANADANGIDFYCAVN